MPSVRRAIDSVDPQLALAQVRTLQDFVVEECRLAAEEIIQRVFTMLLGIRSQIDDKSFRDYYWRVATYVVVASICHCAESDISPSRLTAGDQRHRQGQREIPGLMNHDAEL